MARIVIPAALRNLCGGSQELDVPAATVDELLRAVDARCPGFYARVVEDGRLRPELAFAVDGEIAPLALHDALGPAAEVTIVPALGGG
ncbi:MoaD/ThiS family protein [Tepidiforma flava]|uniref:MoaD/ThiS family protein n=1 Tax=Tepidiforma flava TaxID=3004094 RepID=A0ABY7M8D3_9CHLR|nr:MoaD/ThiS family protein [Tepidiforma flava]WBL36289.1 MoaD/ThiS family protein [Tepidiforma flava]